MAQPIDLDRLQEKMIEIKHRLVQIRIFIEAIDREINSLIVLEGALEENLAILKKKHIIALAQEYRKAKDDLNKTRNRMAYLRIDKETHQRAFDGNDATLMNLKNTYVKELSNVGKNVIQGKFGRKND